MRGEDEMTSPAAKGVLGSPPHARGRRHGSEIAHVVGGITPACAGKTVRFPRESDKTNC